MPVPFLEGLSSAGSSHAQCPDRVQPEEPVRRAAAGGHPRRRSASGPAVELPLDAFPDTTPVQVQINTVAPELSPEEVERLITFPVELCPRRAEGAGRGPLDLEVRPVAGRGDLRRRHRHLLRPPADQRAARRGRAPGGDRPADDGAGRDRARRGLSLLPHQRRFRSASTELRTLQDWVIRPRLRRVSGRGRDQRLGRAGEAVRGARRAGEAGQVRA